MYWYFPLFAFRCPKVWVFLFNSNNLILYGLHTVLCDSARKEGEDCQTHQKLRISIFESLTMLQAQGWCISVWSSVLKICSGSWRNSTTGKRIYMQFCMDKAADPFGLSSGFAFCCERCTVNLSPINLNFCYFIASHVFVVAMFTAILFYVCFK